MIDTPPFTGTLAHDVPAMLHHHECPKTALHCGDVATESRRVAQKIGLPAADCDRAEAAGWLHDVSAVYPNAERIAIARQHGIPVLAEEEAFPMIIHQKISAVMAAKVFGITDAAIISAVGCHTTLKANATILDKVVFIADKIAWDQPGTPPYLDKLLIALEKSLDAAVLVYLQYLWDMREGLRVIHPWFRDAYLELSGTGDQG